MRGLHQFVKNAAGLSDDKIFVLTFNNPNMKSLVISLNHGQLQMGETADDDFLPEYSRGSIDFYNKRAGRFTLYDTGEFYKSFAIAAVNGAGITIFADTIKEDKDLLEYGAVIGLNGESLSILIEEALPLVIEAIKNELLKGI